MKKLESTKQITIGSILRVYKKGFGYSKLEVIDNNNNYLGTLTDNEFTTNVKQGDVIESYLWVENIASFEFELKIIGRINSKIEVLFFDHTGDITWSEKRKCLKAKVNIPIQFFVFSLGNKEKKITSEKIILYNGTIIELGDRNAKIECPENLPEDQFYNAHAKIDNINYEFVGKIKKAEGKSKKKYNISFTNMSDKKRNKILDHIFNIYRE